MYLKRFDGKILLNERMIDDISFEPEEFIPPACPPPAVNAHPVGHRIGATSLEEILRRKLPGLRRRPVRRLQGLAPLQRLHPLPV